MIPLQEKHMSGIYGEGTVSVLLTAVVPTITP